MGCHRGNLGGSYYIRRKPEKAKEEYFMKKLITMVLVLALTLSLCACQGSGSEGGGKMEGLTAGYARASILPEGPVPMGGYGNSANRISNGYLDIPYVTCLALSENGETVLMFSQDLLRSTTAWTQTAREFIFQETGVPADHIMVAATHTHSSADISSKDSRIAAYNELYTNAMVTAAKEAIADLAPATMYSKKVMTDGMTFVRHFELSDGSYGGANFGDFVNNTIVGYATDCDEEMILVKFDRGEEKKDIMLMNFQAHPCFTGSTTSTKISADFIAPIRDVFENETGMHFIYFTGSAGNQNANTRIPEDDHDMDNVQYGTALAQYAIDALPDMEKIEGIGTKTAQLKYRYPCYRPNMDKLIQAKEAADLYDKTGDLKSANALAKSYGFSSVFECRGVVFGTWRPEQDVMELNALYVAGLAFITAPYEMFSDTAMYIKENSPFDTTVICSCATDMVSYFPTKEAYDYGCYESFTAHYARGCAEDSADQLVNMLKSFQ